jgi:hypothetical protein
VGHGQGGRKEGGKEGHITAGFGQRPQLLHSRYTRTDIFVRCIGSWGMAVTCGRYRFLAVSLFKMVA